MINLRKKNGNCSGRGTLTLTGAGTLMYASRILYFINARSAHSRARARERAPARAVTKNVKQALFLFLFSWGPMAISASVSDVLQAKLNSIHTMSASFSQVVHANHREVSRSSGTMALSRPGRFRWQTTHPMAQLVLADGQHLWIYDTDLEQVTFKKQDKGLGGTAALFLSRYDQSVMRDFSVTSHTQGAKTYFDLQSRSNKAHFQRISLTFEGPFLRAMVLFDPLGQRTDITLTQVKNNQPLKPALFKFTPPQGVDVVRQ